MQLIAITMRAKLIAAAEAVLRANPRTILTGSLALNLQGVPTLRPPTDIDILAPVGAVVHFTLQPGQTLERPARPARLPQQDQSDRQEEYNDPLFERTSYLLREGETAIKIDLFHAQTAEAFTVRERSVKQEKNLRLDAPRLILASKVAYALDAQSSEATRAKHRLDVMHILVSAEPIIHY